ncbi:class I SAM-dependent methyltransferase [Pseudoxanthomonas sp. Root630]|uniref:class I SAM-dependent methyltransferase n=1 Tax=Pseudoxanthomonas sp. Root630 TaxID=1736574 RepID=UPI00138F46BD|nr:class I SAM-dependent methyltransferase [Pseudoxanthomonas sp. Root630]
MKANARGVVLDVGCASRWAEQALPPSCTYIGIDYPSTGTTLYEARPTVFANAERLPFGDETADTVLLSEVLEHLRNPQSALQEIRRVLKPDGRVLITLPFLYPIHDAPYDFQRYTSFGLQREVEAAGMRVIGVRRTLGALRTGAVLACLALGGVAQRSLLERSPSVLLLPLLGALIALINLAAWILGPLLPDWPALTLGYRLEAARNG